MGRKCPRPPHFGESVGQAKGSARPQLFLRRVPQQEDIPWLLYLCCAQYLAKEIWGECGLGVNATRADGAAHCRFLESSVG